MFLSLDFLYVPAPDFDVTLRYYTYTLGAKLVWKVRAMGTVVAQIELSPSEPALLLTDHVDGQSPILIYRVADFRAAVAELRRNGVTGGHELDIPHGPVFRFDGPNGQRLAIYELTRPEAANHFAGRIDD